MAKKTNSQGYDTSEFIKLPNLAKDEPLTYVEEKTQSIPELVRNGKGLGVYYDETLKRYVIASLDLCPESNSAIITNKKVLTGSKIAAILTADVDLKKLLEKELK